MLKFLIFLICFSLAGQSFKISGAKIPDYDEKGRLLSVINCASALQKNGRVDMTEVSLKVFDEHKSKMWTKSCQLFEFEKKLEGQEKIYLKNAQMDLEGRGFEYDQKSKILLIKNDVVLYINPAKEAVR